MIANETSGETIKRATDYTGDCTVITVEYKPYG